MGHWITGIALGSVLWMGCDDGGGNADPCERLATRAVACGQVESRAGALSQCQTQRRSAAASQAQAVDCLLTCWGNAPVTCGGFEDFVTGRDCSCQQRCGVSTAECQLAPRPGEPEPGEPEPERPTPSDACQVGEFTCGPGECIPARWVCNGEDDCGNGADESRGACPDGPMCAVGQFRCDDATCIPDGWTCDGDEDCTDGSDEVDCARPPPGPPPGLCTDAQVSCRDGECIAQGWVCDGEDDCASGLDERACASCSDCIVAYCPEAHQRCQANALCTELVRCLNVCGADRGCQNGCRVYAGSGERDLDQVFECANRRCSALCR